MILTPRQHEVLQLVAMGLRDGEIAEELAVDLETVKSHVKKMLVRLEARSRTHAVDIGWRSGLLGVDVRPPA